MTEGQKHFLKVFPGAKAARDMWGVENIRAQRNTYNLYSKEGVESVNPIMWILATE